MSTLPEVDVVVVGGGVSGLIAAITAREAGSTVLLVEASDVKERGGNGRFASGVVRFAHTGKADLRRLVDDSVAVPWERLVIDAYDAEAFAGDVLRSAEYQVDPDAVAMMTRRSMEVAEWLTSRGVAWRPAYLKFVGADAATDDRPIRIPAGAELLVDGNGVALVETLYIAAERAGVQIWYDSPVIDLLMDGLRATGVIVATGGGSVTVPARAVVLASGGFQASAEARVRYLGSNWEWALVRGTRYNTGAVLDRAITAGASTTGQWSAAHAVPVDAGPLSRDAIGDETARYSYPYGITINANGERFFDEGEDDMNLTYSAVGRRLMEQPGGKGFQLFDAKTVGLLEARYETATPMVADSLEALADDLGIDRAALVRTVTAFNTACGDGEFDAFAKDGMRARPPGQPAKSNWAQPIDTAPYRAYRVTTGITFTLAGVAVDEASRVLAASGRAMPGLFACGEVVGGFIANRVPGGTAIMKSAVTALAAGESAYAWAAASEGE